MTAVENGTIWIVILGLGLGSYFLRFSFTGLIGERQMPEWLLRHLRYTAVAILPGLVAPLVVWPNATGGTLDPARILAALATLAVGFVTKSVLSAMAAGALVLYSSLYFLG